MPEVLLQKRLTLPEGWIIELSRIAELGISQHGPISVCLYQRGCPGPPTRMSLHLGIRQREGNSKRRHRAALVFGGENCPCVVLASSSNMISPLVFFWPLRYYNTNNQNKKISHNNEERGLGERPYSLFFSWEIGFLVFEDVLLIDLKGTRLGCFKKTVKNGRWFWVNFMVAPCICNIKYFIVQLMHINYKSVDY